VDAAPACRTTMKVFVTSKTRGSKFSSIDNIKYRVQRVTEAFCTAEKEEEQEKLESEEVIMMKKITTTKKY
jgi:hypothetical protein